MTIPVNSSTPAKVTYYITDKDSYEIPFPFLANGDWIRVSYRLAGSNVVSGVLKNHKDYEIATSAVPLGGIYGYLVFLSGASGGYKPPNGTVIIMTRNVEIAQNETFVPGQIFAKPLNFVLDKIFAILQDNSNSSYALHMPIDSNLNLFSSELPPVADFSGGKYIRMSDDNTHFIAAEAPDFAINRALRIPNTEPEINLLMPLSDRAGCVPGFTQSGILTWINIQSINELSKLTELLLTSIHKTKTGNDDISWEITNVAMYHNKAIGVSADGHLIPIAIVAVKSGTGITVSHEMDGDLVSVKIKPNDGGFLNPLKVDTDGNLYVEGGSSGDSFWEQVPGNVLGIRNKPLTGDLADSFAQIQHKFQLTNDTDRHVEVELTRDSLLWRMNTGPKGLSFSDNGASFNGSNYSFDDTSSVGARSFQLRNNNVIMSAIKSDGADSRLEIRDGIVWMYSKKSGASVARQGEVATLDDLNTVIDENKVRKAIQSKWIVPFDIADITALGNISYRTYHTTYDTQIDEGVFVNPGYMTFGGYVTLFKTNTTLIIDTNNFEPTPEVIEWIKDPNIKFVRYGYRYDGPKSDNTDDKLLLSQKNMRRFKSGMFIGTRPSANEAGNEQAIVVSCQNNRTGFDILYTTPDWPNTRIIGISRVGGIFNKDVQSQQYLINPENQFFMVVHNVSGKQISWGRNNAFNPSSELSEGYGSGSLTLSGEPSFGDELRCCSLCDFNGPSGAKRIYIAVASKGTTPEQRGSFIVTPSPSGGEAIYLKHGSSFQSFSKIFISNVLTSNGDVTGIAFGKIFAPATERARHSTFVHSGNTIVSHAGGTNGCSYIRVKFKDKDFVVAGADQDKMRIIDLNAPTVDGKATYLPLPAAVDMKKDQKLKVSFADRKVYLLCKDSKIAYIDFSGTALTTGYIGMKDVLGEIFHQPCGFCRIGGFKVVGNTLYVAGFCRAGSAGHIIFLAWCRDGKWEFAQAEQANNVFSDGLAPTNVRCNIYNNNTHDITVGFRFRIVSTKGNKSQIIYRLNKQRTKLTSVNLDKGTSVLKQGFRSGNINTVYSIGSQMTKGDILVTQDAQDITRPIINIQSNPR